MSSFANDLTHPLLEKLDNTEVIEVEAESGCSQPAHKHVNLIIDWNQDRLPLELFSLQTGPMLVVSPSVSVMNWEEGRKMEIAQIASQTTRMDTPE